MGRKGKQGRNNNAHTNSRQATRPKQAQAKTHAHAEDDTFTSSSPSGPRAPPLNHLVDEVFAAVSLQSLAGSSLAGLTNLGNTCFMNSTLQVIGQTGPIVQYFINRDPKLSDPLERDMAKALRATLRRMRESTKPVSPGDLFGTIKSRYSSFRGHAQQDAEEFFRRLVESLVEDEAAVHKKALDLLAKHSLSSESSSAVLDKNQLIRLQQHDRESLARNGEGAVAHTFGFAWNSRVSCLHCGLVSVHEERALDLQLQLPARFISTVKPSTSNLNSAPKKANQSKGAKNKAKRMTKRERRMAARKRENELLNFSEDGSDTETVEERDDEKDDDRNENKDSNGDAVNINERSESALSEGEKVGEEKGRDMRKDENENEAQVEESTESAKTNSFSALIAAPVNAKPGKVEAEVLDVPEVPSIQEVVAESNKPTREDEREKAEDDDISGDEEEGPEKDCEEETTKHLDLTAAEAREKDRVTALLHEFRKKREITHTAQSVLVVKERDARVGPAESPRDKPASSTSLEECLSCTTSSEIIEDYACYVCTRRAIEKDQLALDKLRLENPREEEQFTGQYADRSDQPDVTVDKNVSISDEKKKPAWQVPLIRGRAVKQLVLKTLPEVLVLHVKRFDSGRKVHVSLDYQRRLSLRAFMDSTVPMPVSQDYELFGVVCHDGELNGGHYTNLVRHGVSGTWFHCSDTRVRVASPDEALTAHRSAYLLFYQRVSAVRVDVNERNEEERIAEKEEHKDSEISDEERDTD